MRGFNRISRLIFAAIFMVASGVSCDYVHEFPGIGPDGEGPIDPTIIETAVTINCRVQLSGVHVASKGAPAIDVSEENDQKYDKRFIVEVHSNEYVDTLVERHIIMKNAEDTSSLMINTSLQARKYKLAIWMDYVLKGTKEDLYYYTGNGTDLSSIHLPSNSEYIAGTDYKDTQYFLSDLDLTPYANEWFADITIEAPLQRPMAKIIFLASDAHEYFSDFGVPSVRDSILERLTATFSYSGYLPTGFNCWTGRLNDSEVGYSFNHLLSYPYTFEDKDYTLVGSDWVFVNGESSSVTVNTAIKDVDGNLLNEVGNILVPIYRGKVTVVIYKFFNKEYVPGIGIDPGFDGEFNVYV